MIITARQAMADDLSIAMEFKDILDTSGME